MDSPSPIFDAALKEDIQLLKTLLNNGEPYMIVDEIGYTVMHIAAQVGSIPCVNVVLDAAQKDGLSPGEVDSKLCGPGKDGATPLSLAKSGWHHGVSKILMDIKTRADPSTQTSAVWSSEKNCDYCPRVVPEWTRIHSVGSQDELTSYLRYSLHQAIKKKNLRLVKSLLDAGADVNKCDGFFHESALHIAVRRGTKKIIRRLLKEECDMTVKDVYGVTPISLAVSLQSAYIVKLLLHKIKDIFKSPDDILLNCFSISSDDPLSSTYIDGRFDIFDILSDLYTSSTVTVRVTSPLHVVCKQKDIGRLRAILRKCPGLVGVVDEHYYYPIHYCAEYGDLEMLHILTKAGGSLDSTNLKSGCNLLHSAASNFSTEILKYLLPKYPNDLNTIGWLGDTPLHKAAKFGNLDAVQILLEHGGDASVINNNRICPLAEALRRGYYDVSVLLCDVTPKLYGSNVILQACYQNNSNFLRLVLKKGFLVQDYSVFWTKALNKRIQLDSTKIELLVEYGINLSGIEDVCNACLKCWPENFNHHPYTLHTLTKYGAFEKMLTLEPSLTLEYILKTIFSIDCTCRFCLSVRKLHQYLPFGSQAELSRQNSFLNLSELCRLKIRKTFAQRRNIVLLKDISQLSIPKCMEEFLAYQTTPAGNVSVQQIEIASGETQDVEAKSLLECFRTSFRSCR